MTGKPSSPGERSSDLAALAADTLLLDALGRGEPAPAGDRVASLLVAWRADLDLDLDLNTDLDLDDVDLAAGAGPTVTHLAVARDSGRSRGRARRVARRVLGVAAAVLVAGAGVALGAGHATPGSPLWPITRVMYPERADNAAAEHTLAQARQAAAEGRQDDARRLLAQAETLIGRVADPAQAQRLRAQLTDVRNTIAATAPNPATPGAPAPTPGSVPATGSAGNPAPTAGSPAPQGPAAAPSVTAGGAPVLPPLIPLPGPSAVSGFQQPGTPLPTLFPPLPPLLGNRAGGGLLPRLP